MNLEPITRNKEFAGVDEVVASIHKEIQALSRRDEEIRLTLLTKNSEQKEDAWENQLPPA